MKKKFFNRPVSTPSKNNPREERRQKIISEKRKYNLLIAWQLAVLTFTSFTLGWLFIKNGWESIDLRDIQIKGNKYISANQINIVTKHLFPNELIKINPLIIKRLLLKELPIEKISVSRILIPPRLEINLKERQPVAFAQRRNSNVIENGLIDKDGVWMPLEIYQKPFRPKSSIYIEGWTLNHQKIIAKVLKQKDDLGSPLKKIMIDANGELSIKTRDFAKVQLGTNFNSIGVQIKTIGHLSKNLPNSFMNVPGTVIDMRNPSKPEIKLKNFRNQVK